MTRILKKQKYILFLLLNSYIFADSFNEVLLASAKSTGIKIYTSCILKPPADPSQEAMCVSLYTLYIAKEQELNSPLPLMLAKEISPYTSSSFDICRFEVDHLIFGKQNELPYCPTDGL
jgi:hypothetical protein